MPATPITFFEITTAAALLLFAEHAGRRAPARGRPRRPARRHQCVAAPARRRRSRPISTRPRGISRRHASRRSRGEGRHPQARLPGRHRAPGLRRGRRRARAPRRGASAPRRSSSATRTSRCTRSAAGSSTRTRRACSTCRCRASPGATSSQCRHRHRGAARGRASATSGPRPSRRACASVDWPARLQRLARGPSPRSRRRRRRALARRRPQHRRRARSSPTPWPISGAQRRRPLVLIVGMLGTKDAEGFLRNFVGLARALIAVPIAGQMAARPAEEVAQIAHRWASAPASPRASRRPSRWSPISPLSARRASSSAARSTSPARCWPRTALRRPEGLRGSRATKVTAQPCSATCLIFRGIGRFQTARKRRRDRPRSGREQQSPLSTIDIGRVRSRTRCVLSATS